MTFYARVGNNVRYKMGKCTVSLSDVFAGLWFAYIAYRVWFVIECRCFFFI